MLICKSRPEPYYFWKGCRKKSVKVHETTLKGIMGSFLLTSRFQGNFKKIYCKDDRLGIVDWTYLFIYFFDTLKFIDYLVPK